MRNSSGSWPRSTRPATTGSWLDSIDDSLRFSWRCGHVSASQPSQRMPGIWSTQAVWPRTAGIGTAKLEGSRFVGEGGHFVDTMSWWIGSDPVETTMTDGWRCRRGAAEPPLRRWVTGDHHLSDEHAPSLPQGDLRGVERGAHRAARQFQAHHGVGGAACSSSTAPRGPGQGSSCRNQGFRRMSVRTGEPMPISLDSLAATTRATLRCTGTADRKHNGAATMTSAACSERAPGNAGS